MAHSYAEDGGKPQRAVPGSISLGLAVDVERKDGTRSLVVPVLHDASELGFADFVARYDELVVGARDNTLDPGAYQGANISLTNPGGIGTVASVPRLMPGQGTIVATGAIGYPPGLTGVEPDKLKELGVQKVMTMTSTYDHRVIQGAESGAFLRKVDAAAPGRGRLLRDRVRGDGPARRGPGRQHAGGGDRRRAGARGRDPRGGAGGRRRAAPGRAGRHLGGQGPPHARPPGRAARPARLRADRRSGARPGARSTSTTS